MFTGIIEEIGTVRSIDVVDDHARLWIGARTVLEGTALGDSISVNGCCLTVDEVDDRAGAPAAWAADLMAETLRATSLADLESGTGVNLERAMKAGSRFGGHLVQGHVDGVGVVVDRREQPGTVFLSVRVPQDLCRYLVPKGSVTIDGASLTIVDIDDSPAGDEQTLDGADIRVGLIPHTLDATVFGDRKVGDRVNLEVDVIAKYVERLLAAGLDTPYVPQGG